MGIDGDTANWNKENFSIYETKKPSADINPQGFGICSSSLTSAPDDGKWRKFKSVFVMDDENLSDSDLFNEIIELCSWYDPLEDRRDFTDDDDDSDDDEALEMIKRHQASENIYKNPSPKFKASKPLTLSKQSSTYLGLSCLRINSSQNFNKRPSSQFREAPAEPKSSKRSHVTFQKHHSMSIDEAIACAAQNLEVEPPPFSPPTSRKTVLSAKNSNNLERQGSEFWNEMDSVAF